MGDLHDRALDKEATLRSVVDEIKVLLVEAQGSLTDRHTDPASVDRSQWSASFGANQHIDIAATQLAALIDEETGLRVGLASSGTPADAGALGPDLQTNLIAQADMRVELRQAQERRALGLAHVDEVNRLLQSALQSLLEAEQRTSQAQADDKHTADLVTAVGAPPLDTLADDSDTVLDSPEFDAADDRLDVLLPGELRARASERFEEALVVVAEANGHAATGETKYHEVEKERRPIEAPVERALAAYLAARGALAAYVASAVDRVNSAASILIMVAAHPDLTDAQRQAVHDDASQESKDSIAAEGELAAALVEARALGRAIDEAILDALIVDPDAVVEDDAAVIAAREALAEAAIQAPIDDALGKYDPLEASKWEVDIPGSLWGALGEFIRIRTDLTELAGIDPVVDLIAPLTSAEQALGDALDARDDHIRKDLAVGLHLAKRRAYVRAAARTQTDRAVHYLRGDGSSGRTPAELASPTV